MIEARRIDDPARWPSSYRRDANGRRGQRFYLINCRDVALASTAAGLPAIGDIWSPAVPQLKARSIDIRPLGGPAPTPDGGGSSVAQVGYESAGSFSGGPTPEPGLVWSRIRASVKSAMQTFNVDNLQPIHDGQGAPRDDSEIEVSVFSYSSSPPNVAPLVSAQRKIHPGSIQVPNFEGSGQPLNFGPGQVRYRVFNIGMRDELFEVEHVLVVAEDHYYTEQFYDEKGVHYASQLHQLYLEQSLLGLW